MARLKSWHWEYCHKDGMANGSHHKGYCNACIQHHFKVIEDEDKAAYESGMIEAMRSKAALITEGDSGVVFLFFHPDCVRHSLHLTCLALNPCRSEFSLVNTSS